MFCPARPASPSRGRGATPARIALGFLLLAGCSSSEDTSPVPVQFTDLALPYRQSALAPGSSCLTATTDCEPEYMTGGAAIGDVDGDGLDDLVVTRLGESDLLFLNEGGSFVEADWGLDAVRAQSNGVALFDADRDGDLDLYVTTLGAFGEGPPNDRYHFFDNQGGRFVEAGEARGLAFRDGQSHAGSSIAVGDVNRDGYPDLFITAWLSGEGDNARGQPHERLLINRGAGAPGHYDDATLPAGVFLAGAQCRDEGIGCTAKSFAATFTDLDADGHTDLAVVADFERSRLFWNRGDGTFEDGTAAAGVGTDENGMGSTFGDVDGDGDLDWFVSSIFDDPSRCAGGGCDFRRTGNRLYRNDGERRFTDVTEAFGVRDGGWGWGAAFFDLDHDADLDLALTNGWDLPRYPLDDHFAGDAFRLWQSGGGTMLDVASELGLRHRAQGRGLCPLDADGDGDLDLLVVEHGAGARLLRNEGAEGRSWLQVRALYEDGAVAYGARIRVRGERPQLREIGTGAHFLCSPRTTAHFGLAGAERVDLDVLWPNGTRTTHLGIAARQVLVLRAP